MKNINRFKAGFIHFCVSISIFSIIFFILFTLWYPEPFFTAGGGWQGLKIAASIDVVLGPLLTLVIFNTLKSKRELMIDVSVIACLQLAALMWGVFTIYQQRPVAAVFLDDNFYTVSAIDLTEQGYALDKLQQFSDHKPPLIYSQRPTSVEGLKKSLALMTDNKIPPHVQTDLYQPLAKHFNEISANQINVAKFRQNDKIMNAELEKFLTSSGISLNSLQFYLLKAKFQDMLLIFNGEGKAVGYLAVSNTNPH